MNKEEEDFLIELLNDFKIEASEHYQAIVNGLIMLEKTDETSVQQSEIEKIFREVHSLKGASRAVNLLDVEKLCMQLETVFNSLKKGDAVLFPTLFDAFHKATDLLNLLLNDVHQNQKNKGNYNLPQILKMLEFAHKNAIQLKGDKPQEQSSNNGVSYQNDAVKVVDALDNHQELDNELPEQNEINETGENAKFQTIGNQTVRISTEKLSSLLHQSEELITLKSTLEYFSQEIQSIGYQYALWNKKAKENHQKFGIENKTQQTKQSNISDGNHRNKHENELLRVGKEMIEFQHVSGRIIDELLHDIKTTLLLPFSSMLGIFPKIVRDLSKEYSKDIDIEIIGDNTEIDRRILEELKDPLIHLIRNCVDHGIENTEERIKKGKQAKGKIEIRIIQNIDRKIELHLKDDGAGLDRTKIITSAVKAGFIKAKEAEKLSDNEAHLLIFQSGVSTSPFITSISGRGLGMAIVAEKVNKLGGSIEIETTKNQGTTFILSLPQTLSTFRGVLVKAAEQHFIMPSSAVERALRVQYSDISTVKSSKTIKYKNEVIAMVLLSDVLKINVAKKKTSFDDYLHLLILNISQKKIGFVVDEILGEQDGIVKDLGLQLSHVNNIAGTTIMGNGKVVPILHPYELMNSAAQTNSTLDVVFESKAATETIVQKRILVAEDSITIRTLIRNFIENAGYYVKTTVDGMEAYELLQQEDFDLVVSDVEMPRMNGFELTAKIREDKKHADVPVILVTALETEYDKQRGLEAGANAYIVKSSFEKSNLVETIQRLI
ncbi:MAG: response regulator [Paludibacter sp.]